MLDQLQTYNHSMMTTFKILSSTVDTPNTAALRTSVKGIIDLTKKKHIHDLKISRSTEGQYWGGGGGDDCI